MISKTDCILLLTSMETKGIDIKDNLTKLLTSDTIPLSILKFINDNRPLEVLNFYEKIRRNYNHKKSDLYINIVKEIEEPQEVLTTLSAMLTQILLYSKKLENKQVFLSHSRAKEITEVLTNYFNNYDIKSAIELIKVIKADLKALESIK